MKRNDYTPSRAALPLTGLAILAVMGVFYVWLPGLYQNIMFIMIKVPAPRLFADWDWLPSSVKCWSHGVNVFVDNTCYTIFPHSSFNYSPLWLRARFLAPLEPWTVPIGIIMCVAWFTSLALLPQARTGRDQVLILATSLSCASFLALERMNVDVMLFLLIMVVIGLQRGPLLWRLAGYGLIILAGLLKFYPFVALILVLRERRAVAAMVMMAAAAALGALILSYPRELSWMLHNLPPNSFFTLQFGARDLPAGLAVMLALTARKLLHLTPPAMHALAKTTSSAILLVLTIETILLALRIGRRTDVAESFPRLSVRQSDLLITGAVLICGCFFAGQSVIYRAIFLTMLLPSLLILSHETCDGGTSQLVRSVCYAIVFVVWVPAIEVMLAVLRLTNIIPYGASAFDVMPESMAGFLLWVCSELAWWWIIALLLTILGGFVVRSPLWMKLVGRVGNGRTGAASP